MTGLGREEQHHGSAMYPVAFYYSNLEGAAVPWHWHDEWEILVVTNGQASFTIGADTILLHEGEGLFINTGKLHAGRAVKGSEGLLKSIVFHPRLVGGSSESIYWGRYLRPLLDSSAVSYLRLREDIDWQREVLEMFRKAWADEISALPGYELEVRYAMGRAILAIQQNTPAAAEGDPVKNLRDEARVKHMLKYIHEHFSEEIRVDDIAASASISHSECLRCFRATVGMPPTRYVRQYRLERASVLLLTTAGSISEIASSCGFEDMSYFTREFRKKYLCTPTEFRTR